ncbi:MAG: M1 family metallopeptidase [Ginsengibacter sp.]
MKRLFLICFLYCQLPFSFCQSNYFQQQVNYNIDVSLNDTANTLDGFETIQYTNNSSDTLHYIWFHLWPNAYKNDRTAFSEQLLQLGRTDFYFSDENKRGYINRLDFKVDGATANLEDHPQYIDIAKLILPEPLLPGQTIKITTPFHEKIPFNFSRGGYVGKTYQITQWYPKPAVYDNKGWHPIPYLDQGEFYSEFGNFNVQITVPENYVVAATGVLQNEDEVKWLREKARESTRNQTPGIRGKQSDVSSEQSVMSRQQTAMSKKNKKIKKRYSPTTNKKQKPSNKKRAPDTDQISPLASSEGRKSKTLTYIQTNTHDFAWFADKNFIVRYDTLQLASGKIIDVYSFFTPSGSAVWKKSTEFIKDAIRTRSKWLGEYPYQVVTAVEAKMGFSGGMEYPTITSISPTPDERSLDMTIEHEVGHNWLYGILASNEREHPWMDEGMNTYFDNRYEKIKYPDKNEEPNKGFLQKRIPDDNTDLIYRTQIASKKDQPIETPSEDFSEINYDVIAYYKTGLWMKKLEDYLGKELFDSCLHEYYNRWKFKHPYPEDFKKVVQEVSGKNVDTIFSLLSIKGNLEPAKKKELKVSSFFNFKNTDKYNYLFLSPSVGYNRYDQLMIGGLINNYTLPQNKFQFFVAPMYAIGSKQIVALGGVNYHWYPDTKLQKIDIGVNGSRFSDNRSMDTIEKDIFQNFRKITPYVKIYFKTKDIHTITWLDIHTFFITQKQFDNYAYKTGSDSLINYPNSLTSTDLYINQISINSKNLRVLYPYDYQIQFQQGKGFYRINLTGNYFFNYAKGGGLSARLFAAKFGQIGKESSIFTYQYEPKLLGGNGSDDYTYSNYFLGRTASSSYADIPVGNDGLAAQQIMIQNTGGLKFRLDPSPVQGQSENWVAAVNLNTSLPNNLFPIKLPVKIFFDAGTYAEAWDKNTSASKFLYVGGLQLSLFSNVLNIYVPIIYSSDFRDYLKTDKEANKFLKKITFSIDIQNFRLNKFLNLPDL